MDLFDFGISEHLPGGLKSFWCWVLRWEDQDFVCMRVSTLEYLGMPSLYVEKLYFKDLGFDNICNFIE